MDRMNYSGKELQLYDFIKLRVTDITASLIKKELGETYLGALGKLIRNEVIEGQKKKLEVDIGYNRFGYKYTKCYTIKEEK